MAGSIGVAQQNLIVKTKLTKRKQTINNLIFIL